MSAIVRRQKIRFIVFPLAMVLLLNPGLFSDSKLLDHLKKQFKAAGRMYFAGRYDLSKRILETLKMDLSKIKNQEFLKGKTCLLLGAAYEKLNKIMDALKNYRLAKKFFEIGKQTDTDTKDGNIIEGLDVNALSWYGYEGKIPPVGVITQPGSRKNTGKVIGMVLGVTIFCALVWYLFIRDTRDKEDQETITDEQSRLWAKYSFLTKWKIDLSGEAERGYPFIYYLEPATGWEPDPNANNDWDDSTFVEIQTRGHLLWGKAVLSVTMNGCGGGIRHDKIWINDQLVLDKQLRFDQDCGTSTFPAGERTFVIYTHENTGNFTIRHRVRVIEN